MAKKTNDKKSPKTEVTGTKPSGEVVEKDNVLKINRDVAAKLLRTMGFKETQKYSNEILERRLNKMKDYVANYDGTLDGETQELVDKVIAAKDNIKVTGDEPKTTKKASDDKPAKDKKADGKKASGEGSEKKGRKPKAGKVAEGAVDAFGSRLGSKNAKVNAMLGKKPITMKDIKDKMNATFYNHLNNLIEQGLVKKTDEGYVVTK